MLARRRSPLAKARVLCIAAFLVGCGRPATESECQLIADRMIELELRATGTTDPVAIAKKTQELRPTFKDSLKECIGRRITDGMINCIRLANTADEINQCIR
jgi:adenosylcobinamide amidohydrolase